MKILEIVRFRSAAGSFESLCEQIDASIQASGKEPTVVAIYRRTGLETDLAIHIHGNATPGSVGPSELGTRLASELEGHGLVDHSLWEGWSRCEG